MKDSSAGSKGEAKGVSVGIQVNVWCHGSMPFKWWAILTAFIVKAITHLNSHL